MRKKIKIGDKVYRVRYCKNIIYIEEKEVLGILDEKNLIFDCKFSLYNQIKGFYNKDEDVFFVEDHFYYRTKKKAVQKGIKEIKLYIKGIQANLLTYKELLKNLNKELKNDFQSR